MNWLQKIAQSQVFYHGSNRKLPIGTILTPQPQGYTRSYDSKREEAIMEKYRPADKLSRHESVFMVTNPAEVDPAGGNLAYIYRVEPIGPVERSDLSWYSDLSVYTNWKPREKRLIASNYWNGVPYPDTKHSLWEYRCRQAKIIELFEDNSDTELVEKWPWTGPGSPGPGPNGSDPKLGSGDRNRPRFFLIGIHKIYFPPELRSSEPGNEFYEVVKEKATSRPEAAQKAWTKHGPRWLPLLTPKQTTVRRISLYVNEPLAGTGGKLGRLGPIEVYAD